MSEIIISKIICDGCKVTTKLLVDGKEDYIHTIVSPNMQQYLTVDRCDTFVVGLMYFAMSNGYDFKSDIPISEDLYYNLDNHFIDAVAFEGSGLHRTKLNIVTIAKCEHTSNIVATGISCGIDCLHTLCVHEKSCIPSFRITHLAFYNVGSHQTGSGSEHDRKLYEGRYNLCKSFAEEYGYTFYTVSSDIHDFIQRHGTYSHVSNHSYMAAFCILLLQKGISRYYYSAGYPYIDFRTYKIHTNEELDSAMYDLLTFYTISIGELKVYSAGGSIKRIDKTRLLATYKPAQKYLNVCVREPKNDGTCFKCIRTLLSLDATGNINDFKEVFDVNNYKKCKDKYLRQTWLAATLYHDELSKEILPLYKKELTLSFKFRAILFKMVTAVRKRIMV